VAVKGPSRKRQLGTIEVPGQRPQSVVFYPDEQYIVKGWNDLLSPFSTAKVAGANQPTWSTYRDGISAYSFSASTTNEVWCVWHVLHDYAESTKVYIHIHHSVITTNTGVVRWGIEYTAQKGHNQGAFPASTTVYLEDNISSNDQYGHRIIEMSDAQAFSTNLETDALILARIFRDGGDAADTFPDATFGLMADIHYQVDKQVTPNKSPPFTAR
jgi:hypothetical protein